MGTWLDKPGCLPLPSFIEDYDQKIGNIFHLFYLSGLLLHTQIRGSTKVEEPSLLVPLESGRGCFESLLGHDLKAQPPLCIRCVLHIANYQDGGGRMMQMPLVSKFLCYLEAEARRELAGTTSRAIPFLHPCADGCQCGEGAR